MRPEDTIPVNTNAKHQGPFWECAFRLHTAMHVTRSTDVALTARACSGAALSRLTQCVCALTSSSCPAASLARDYDCV